jgi:tRNA A-37 threonylcarbamoyl transferase component Bud32
MTDRQKELPRGTVLGGRYEVIQKLGEGSFSAVYRVRDKSLDVECAIKVLHMWASFDPKLLERFKREVLYSRRIVHEGCCQVFDFAEYEDVAVLAMELVAGWTLDTLVDKLGPVPLEAAYSLIAQAASSVAVLHKNDIIHRDIKAENMMVTREGRLKILDLGLSWSSELSSLTAVGSILGTPAYMAPEFIMGGAPTPQSDVYAFGVLSYLVLTGRLPFEAPDLAKLLAMHMQGEPKPVRQLRPEVPAEVEKLVLRCLSKPPEKRPQSAGALEEAWIRILGGPPSPEQVRRLVVSLGVPPAAQDPGPPVPAAPEVRRGSGGGMDSFTNMVLTALEPDKPARRSKAKPLERGAREAPPAAREPAKEPVAAAARETEMLQAPERPSAPPEAEKGSVTEIVELPEVLEALRQPPSPESAQTRILEKPAAIRRPAEAGAERASKPTAAPPELQERGETAPPFERASAELQAARRKQVRLLAVVLVVLAVLASVVLGLVLARSSPQGLSGLLRRILGR